MSANDWVIFGVFFVVGSYFAPGFVAFHHWMAARRDELHNRAKVAKRERR